MTFLKPDMESTWTRLQRHLVAIVVIALCTILMAQQAWALAVPELKGRVNDYAHMLTAQTARQLEAFLADLDQTDGTQIVVLTIPSLEGDSLEDFSIRTAEAWGIGQKGTDNGAILLIAKNDRKIRIEVGYGLEGTLTDLTSGRIIRNVISPRFKNGQFDQGVIDGVAAMVGTVRGEYQAPERPRGSGRRNSGGSPGIIGLFVLFLLLRVVGRISRVLGAVAGGVIAPIAGLLFFGTSLATALLLIPIGLFVGMLAALFGSPLSFGHSGYSSHRGGSFGGGGFSSGGGFGGFSGGGGGFGGGGASGGW